MSASVWKKCRLDQVSDINPQTGAIPNEFVYVDLESVVAGELLSVNFLSKKDAPSRAQRNLSSGDILYQTVRPYQRNNYFFEGDKKKYVASTGYAQIKAKEFNKYLYHYLHTDDFISDVLSRCTGTSYPAIAPKELSRVLVYLPLNREEQKHISDILSTCDTVIQNTQKTIDKYKAIKQGMMQDLFTRGLTKDGKLRPSYKEAPELYKESELGMIPKEWEVDSIENLTTYFDYRGKTPIKIESGIQLVTAKNIKDGFIDYNISKEFIAKEDYNSVMSRGLPKLGDVLFTTEAPVGNVAQINDENVALAQRVIKFRGKEISMDNAFLLYSFLSEYFRRILLSESTGSTAQGIKGSRLHKLLLKYPSIPEQKKINEKLSSIDSTIQKEEAILKKYKNIKTGLMARLLTPPEDAEIIDETGE